MAFGLAPCPTTCALLLQVFQEHGMDLGVASPKVIAVAFCAN
eukprot:CAMPEP_0194483594 /NCGR_PEP_ID=MMETSP0253-20130528/5142_1 /TAXON_ID=2966 /ORGANISM="Noctiluca scintillans" /LENGTH=41 /DNA_ID= /DNA_START= /DNA_END= /DNA_ORIENTATION=